jgi:hypothetical protein
MTGCVRFLGSSPLYIDTLQTAIDGRQIYYFLSDTERALWEGLCTRTCAECAHGVSECGV